MRKETWDQIKGLKSLVHDGIQHGADFVEKHHRHTAKKPFEVLESFDTIAKPTQIVRTVHDGVLSLTYGSIRAINQATEVADDWVLSKLAPAEDEPEDKNGP